MTTSSEHKLAIVLPAYKPEFLRDALASISNQTDRDFTVYVGDDHSPSDLRAMIDSFSGHLDIRYHRFEENRGRRSLVEQWNRCIRLSEEPWVWLFSDDDVMDAGCVAAWRATLSNHPLHDVYRFQTRTIDGTGNVTRWNPQHPEYESSLSFVYQRMSRARLSFGCEYIFSRAAFDREGGMVDFPLAWCSDDASWAAFGAKTGIRTVPGPRVDWRYSGRNLSFAGPSTRAAKRAALFQYLEWLNARMGDFTGGASDPDVQSIKALMPAWLMHQLKVADCLADRKTLKRLNEVIGQPRSETLRDFIRLARHNMQVTGQRLRNRVTH
ncbi:MAG TPA: glycosyltransferase [Kiritimatiellia bacterium]|nr:glycosyltransferase [Kiritimatiellia bacterium]